MNFFESQDAAKKSTGRLFLLFFLAVISLIAVTNLLLMFLLGIAGSQSGNAAGSPVFSFDWGSFFLVGVGVSVVVLLGSLYKIGSLRGGGARIAEMMNGKLLVSGSQDLHERRVLNVVEEMAIASGTPVPPVYLMEEAGINAFAAGYSPSDAVIGVTRGTINLLSRDQLQGVVAHEFSHILHGDMRINIRLIGVLHGIMVLGIIGHSLLRGGMYSRRSKESGGIMALGLGLLVVGFVGTFFGNLIKAAVSRQREFLADASAVQFTRNPEGIGGALMQIANHSEGSLLNNPKSVEISHTLFEEGQVSAFNKLYATHPPLPDRIRAILPNWDGRYDVPSARAEAQVDADESAEPTQAERAKAMLGGAAGVILTDALLQQVGNPNRQHLDFADDLLRSMPEALLSAVREPSAARAVIYRLVLANPGALREEQLSYLQTSADLGVYRELTLLMEEIENIDKEFRLPLIEIAIASLRQLSARQYDLFRQNFNAVIALDKKINLFEWALQKILFHHLDVIFDKVKRAKLGKRDLGAAAQSSRVLLSMLAHSNPQQGISTDAAYNKAAEMLALKSGLLTLDTISFEKLNAALDELVNIKPLQKPQLLKACVLCITADGQIAPIESELLRAIAATIDCPMPPLIVPAA